MWNNNQGGIILLSDVRLWLEEWPQEMKRIGRKKAQEAQNGKQGITKVRFDSQNRLGLYLVAPVKTYSFLFCVF
jgi:hypothetical protein